MVWVYTAVVSVNPPRLGGPERRLSGGPRGRARGGRGPLRAGRPKTPTRTRSRDFPVVVAEIYTVPKFIRLATHT